MCEPEYITHLKQTLFSFPTKCYFRFRKDEKKLLRECLFRALSQDGKYLGLIFPGLFENKESSAPTYVTPSHDFKWLFSDYDRIIAQLVCRRPNDTDHRHIKCSKIFRRGEPIYNCSTCGFDDMSALCSKCYQAEQHIEHEVHINICQQEIGSSCDCGNTKAWVKYFVCRNSSRLGAKRITLSPFLYIPKDLEQTFTETICVLLDFIIDVMSQSDLHLYAMNTTEVESDLKGTSYSLDSNIYGFDTEDTVQRDELSGSYSLLLYNDQVHHLCDAIETIHQVSRKVREFAVMIANQVHTNGRAIVMRSRNHQLLHDRQKILSASGLSSCIRDSKDEFRENMCQEIVFWLSGLTERNFFKNSDALKNNLCYCFVCKWNPGIKFTQCQIRKQNTKEKLEHFLQIPDIKCDSSFSRENLHWSYKSSKSDTDATLCVKCNHKPGPTLIFVAAARGSRFQYLVYFDVRFWKSVRSVIHDLYLSSVIPNWKYKKLLAWQYVAIYPVVADLFLNIDCDPELNIMTKLSSQLLTCLSHSNSFISHGDVTRIFLSAYNFLRNGDVMVTGENLRSKQTLSLKSLKNRRWAQIFLDMGYLISRGKDKELIRTDKLIHMTCDILFLFQGALVLKREKENHVEYENLEYTVFFNTVLVVYQFAEHISQSILNLDTSERQKVFRKAIDYVIGFLFNLKADPNQVISVDQAEINLGQRVELSSDNEIREQESAKVSLLHPVHSFLSWLIEFSNFESRDQLNVILRNRASTNYVVNSEIHNTEIFFDQIFGYAIQTVVVLSQIKSGFWVRNGISVMRQLQLYKTTSLREQGYLRDLFLVQVFAACSDATTVMTVILKKWLLYEWALGSKECIYKSNVLWHVIEECLRFFLHILTEDLLLRGLPTETTTYLRIKSELIHYLCFRPSSYSMLSSEIPQHVLSNKNFDSILNQLTSFKKSKSSNETGIYALKDEYFAEVDPYYFEYTMNRKDEAITLIKERIAKSESQPLCDIVISPRQRKEDVLGVYKYLASFTCVPLFTTFLTKVLAYIRIEGVTKLDGLLETVLHLIHVCSTESYVDSAQSSFLAQMFKMGDLGDMSLAIHLYRLLGQEELKEHHSKIKEIFRTLGTRHQELESLIQDHLSLFEMDGLDTFTKSKGQKEKNCKRYIAQEKRAKLMAKLQKQQDLFSRKNSIFNDCNDAKMEESVGKGWKFPQAHCILCQDTSESAGPFGIITHISKSSVFRTVPFGDPYWFLKAFSDGANLNSMEVLSHEENYSAKWLMYMKKANEDWVVGPGFTESKAIQSRLISLTCGHCMHFHCYIQYLSNWEFRLIQITRNTSNSAEHSEFLCPLCKAISNMFIPILWDTSNRSWSKFVCPHIFQKKSHDALMKYDSHDESRFLKFCHLTTQYLKEFSILTKLANDIMCMHSRGSSCAPPKQCGQLFKNMFLTSSVLGFPQIFKAECPSNLINTIKSVEISLRGVKVRSGLLINNISNSRLLILRALNESRLSSLLASFTQNSQSDAHIRQFSNLQSLGSKGFNDAVTRSDFFEILVKIFPASSADFNYNSIMETCFLGCILQVFHIVMTEIVMHNFYTDNDFNMLDIPYSNLITDSESSIALKLFKIHLSGLLRMKDREKLTSNRVFGFILYSMILKSVTPFLRQSAIYTYVCCGNADSLKEIIPENYKFEADLLCLVLQLPTLCDILQCMIKDSTYESKRFLLFQNHIRNKNQASNTKEITFSKLLDYPGIIRLIELPETLDMFFTDYYYLEKYNFPYLHIDKPAICLFCAKIVDMQRRADGSPYGQCNSHYMTECVGSFGIYLLPKEKCTLLLHKSGGTFYDAPYLDNHNELNAENKRGKQAFLLKHIYYNLRNLWLEHAIPNVIVRRLDNVTDQGGWDTL